MNVLRHAVTAHLEHVEILRLPRGASTHEHDFDGIEGFGRFTADPMDRGIARRTDRIAGYRLLLGSAEVGVDREPELLGGAHRTAAWGVVGAVVKIHDHPR